jgi:hypothetical protein
MLLLSGFFYEKIKIHRQPDSGDTQIKSSGYTSDRALVKPVTVISRNSAMKMPRWQTGCSILSGMNGWICTALKASIAHSLSQHNGYGHTITNDRIRQSMAYHQENCWKRHNPLLLTSVINGGLPPLFTFLALGIVLISWVREED